MLLFTKFKVLCVFHNKKTINQTFSFFSFALIVFVNIKIVLKNINHTNSKMLLFMFSNIIFNNSFKKYESSISLCTPVDLKLMFLLFILFYLCDNC